MDNVTDVDAYAELNPTIFGNIGIAFDHGALDLHGAAHGVNSASNSTSAPSRRLDDTAAMFRNLGIDEFAAVPFKRCERPFLVTAHQPTVAGDIGRKDSSRPPFDARLGHEDRPELTGIVREFMAEGGVCLPRQRPFRNASIEGVEVSLWVMYGRCPRCKRNLTISEAFGCGHVFGLT